VIVPFVVVHPSVTEAVSLYVPRAPGTNEANDFDDAFRGDTNAGAPPVTVAEETICGDATEVAVGGTKFNGPAYGSDKLYALNDTLPHENTSDLPGPPGSDTLAFRTAGLKPEPVQTEKIVESCKSPSTGAKEYRVGVHCYAHP
jgi:hypothetical protein